MRAIHIVLAAAALGLAAAVLVLLLGADPEAPRQSGAQTVSSPASSRPAVKPGPGPERPRDEPSPKPRPDSSGGDAAGLQGGDAGSENRPAIQYVKDAGPPFDPYAPKMTGEPAYDRQTRVAAAHALYDREDYEAALSATRALLAEADDMRVRRLLVVSACATGEDRLAREHAAQLPAQVRKLAERQCQRLGIELAGE